MQLCSAFAHILVVGSTALAKQEKKDHDQFFKRHFHTLFTEPKKRDFLAHREQISFAILGIHTHT